MPLGGWIAIALVILLMGGAIGFITYENVKTKKVKKETKIHANEPTYFDNTIVEKKGIRSRSEGLHQPRRVIDYGVLFVTETGEKKLFLVSKEVFESLEEGQTGTLVIMNGQFYDFGDGEDAS